MTAPTTHIPSNSEPRFAAPSGPKVSREIQSVLQLPRLARHAPNWLRLPRGNQTVMVFPGWSTSDLFMAPLRSMLKSLGHRPHGWGLGFNTGDVETLLPSIEYSVSHLAASAEAPVTLIGWSLGGIFAREVARNRPELVEQVITYATPVYGGPKYTRGASAYSQEHIDRLESRVLERDQIPIQRPITALYSKADAIVDWRACIDDFSPFVENVEVSSTHVGTTIDPDAWKITAGLLARPPSADNRQQQDTQRR